MQPVASPTPAEQHLYECARAGREADFSDHAEKPIIRAAVVVRSLLGLAPDGEALDRGFASVVGVRVKCAVIDGRVELDWLTPPEAEALPLLHLERCLLTDGLSARWTTLRGLLLDDCRVDSRTDDCVDQSADIHLEGAKVRSDVSLNGLRAERPDSRCRVDGNQCRIEGSLRARACHLSNRAPGDQSGRGFALVLNSAVLEGNVDLRGKSHLVGGLNLESVRIRGNLELGDACIEGDTWVSLNAQSARIAGAVFLGYEGSGESPYQTTDSDGRFVSRGSLWFSGASLEKGAYLKGCRLEVLDEPQAFVLEGATIGGLYMFARSTSDETQRLECLGQLNLAGTVVNGDINIRGVRIESGDPGHDGVTLTNARIRGGLTFSSFHLSGAEPVRSECVGGFTADRCRVTGGVQLSGARLSTTSHGSCLSLAESEVGGSLFMNCVDGPEGTRQRFEALSPIMLRQIQVGGYCMLEGASVADPRDGVAVYLQGAKIRGVLSFAPDDSESGAVRFEATGEVWLASTEIGDQLWLNGAQIRSDGNRASLWMDRLRCPEVFGKPHTGSDGVDRTLRVEGGISLRHARLGHVDLSAARLEAKEPRAALDLEETVIKGRCLLRPARSGGSLQPTVALGAVSLRRVRVGTSIELQGLQVTVEAGVALDLDQAHLEGDLDLRAVPDTDGSPIRGLIQGTMSLAGARVDGDIVLSGARLGKGTPDSALTVHRAMVGGSILLSPFRDNAGQVVPFEALGAIGVTESEIRGNLLASGARLSGPLPVSLAVRATTLKGDLVLSPITDPDGARHPVQLGSGVWVGDSKIQGTLVGAGHSDGKSRLALFDSTIGKLALGPAEAELRLEEGSVEVRNCTVNESILVGQAQAGRLAIERCRVGGSVSLAMAWSGQITRFAVAEGCSLAGSSIAGDVYVVGGTYRGNPRALDLRQTRVKGVLSVNHTERCPILFDGSVDLRGACLSRLADANGTAWRGADKLLLTGLTYDSIVPSESTPIHTRWSGEGWGWRLAERTCNVLVGPQGYWVARSRWLRRQFAGGQVTQANYSPQPYEQLVRVVKSEGDLYAGRHIEREKRRIEGRLLARRQAWPVSWLARCCIAFYDSSFGYGLSPFRAITTVVLAILAGGVAIEYANSIGMLIVDATPVTGIAVQKEGDFALGFSGERVGVPNEAVPCGDAIVPTLYAADIFIPLIDLKQEHRCRIRPSGAVTAGGVVLFFLPTVGSPGVWHWARSAYTVFGWLTVSMAILTFTAVLKREDSAT